MMQSMIAPSGMQVVLNSVDYATGWVPNYLRNKGDFDGLAIYSNGARADVGQWLQTFFSSAGANNQVGKSYPELDKMIFAQQQIADFAKRVSAMHEIQRYMIENSIAMPIAGEHNVESVSLSWQGVGNRQLRTWAGGVANSERTPLYWLDKSLRG